MQARARRGRAGATAGRRIGTPRGSRAAAAEAPRSTSQRLPTGTITFLFTDVEGGTSAWLRNTHTMGAALARHYELIEHLVAAHRGQLVCPRGEGDSRFVVFARASDAVSAPCAVQLVLVGEQWSLAEPLRVRLAVHTGEADLRLAIATARQSITARGFDPSHMAARCSSQP